MMLKATEGGLISANVPSSPLNRSQPLLPQHRGDVFLLVLQGHLVACPSRFPGMGPFLKLCDHRCEIWSVFSLELSEKDRYG